MAPTFYFTNPYAVIGPADDVPMPPGSQRPGLRARGRCGHRRDGPRPHREQARDHIVGYTIFNDWSARDLQPAEMKVGLGPAKGKDTATTLGPWLVTADELEPYRDADGFLRPGADGVASTASGSATTGCPTWAGRSRRWSPTPPAAPGSARRRARLGHLRQRRLPRGAVGSQRVSDPAAAEAWGRRHAHRAGHRQHQHHRGARGGSGSGSGRAAPARRPERHGERRERWPGRSSSSPVPPRGQGAAQAAACAAAGATVIGLGLTPADGVRRHDVACRGRLGGAARRTSPTEYGTVHGLVNNAGITHRARLLEVQLDRSGAGAVGQPGRAVARHPGPGATDDRRRVDRQHRLRRRPHRPLPRRLHHQQVGAARPFPGRCHGARTRATSGSTPSTPASSRPP